MYGDDLPHCLVPWLKMSSDQHNYAVYTTFLSVTHGQMLVSHLRNTHTVLNVVHV